jgi:hypothetical protein
MIYPPVVLYRFFNESDDLLYVGITVNASIRFRDHQYKQWWFDEVAYRTCELHDDRADAALAELTAIQQEHPKYNVMGTANEVRPAPPLHVHKERSPSTAEMDYAFAVWRVKNPVSAEQMAWMERQAAVDNLSPGVWIDCLLWDASEEGRWEGCDFDDDPEMVDWLLGVRQQI